MLCDTHLQAFPIIYKLTHDEAAVRADERKKMNDSSVKPIIDILPIVGMVGALSMIPSSRRRKNAVMKMVSKEFQKQLMEARASEREKCYKEWGYNEEYKNGWKEGQAELIGRLTSTKSMYAIWKETDKRITNHDIIFIIKTAIKKASESAGDKK
jgi:hypothetical protein